MYGDMRQVGYSFIAWGFLKAVFLLCGRLAGCVSGGAGCFTGVMGSLTGYTGVVGQGVGLGVAGSLSYSLMSRVDSFAGALRRTHTGLVVLPYNLIAVQAGGVILLLVFLALGGHL